MKRILAFIISAILCVGVLTACSSNKKAEKKASEDTTKSEVIVFAAASMTKTLTELGDAYMKEHPDVKLTFNFDSSGTLKAQITEGADCDLFISAAQKQMNELDKTADKEKNPDGLDFIDPDSRIDLLENKVALCVPEGASKGIDSYDALAKQLKNGEVLLAMGNADVPVGQYTQKIFSYYKLNEEDLAKAGKLTYGSNVKEVASQVAEGSVDCGIIYQTDAYSANLKIVDTATEEMCGQVIYPAAVMKNSKNADAAAEFLKFLQTDQAAEVFTKVGFTIPRDVEAPSPTIS